MKLWISRVFIDFLFGIRAGYELFSENAQTGSQKVMTRARGVNLSRQCQYCNRSNSAELCRKVYIQEHRDGWKIRLTVVIIILLFIRVMLMQSKESKLRALH